MDTWLCTAQPFRYSPETITTLLIGYIPIQKSMLKTKLAHNSFILSSSVLTMGLPMVAVNISKMKLP